MNYITLIILYLVFVFFISFYRTTGFSGVIGCRYRLHTHVMIVPPSMNLNLVENQHAEYLYVNRKKITIIVQFVYILNR